jgi:diadenosine tetraphosphate (Ap4A) HIT family hydrolase
VLVIPTTHVANGDENAKITAKTIEHAMSKPRVLMRRAIAHLGEKVLTHNFDYNTQFSNGPDATQTVFHLHIHLVPRQEDDLLPIFWTGQTKNPGCYNCFKKDKIKVPKCQEEGVAKEDLCFGCKDREISMGMIPLMTKEQQKKKWLAIQAPAA